MESNLNLTLLTIQDVVCKTSSARTAVYWTLYVTIVLTTASSIVLTLLLNYSLMRLQGANVGTGFVIANLGLFFSVCLLNICAGILPLTLDLHVTTFSLNSGTNYYLLANLYNNVEVVSQYTRLLRGFLFACIPFSEYILVRFCKLLETPALMVSCSYAIFGSYAVVMAPLCFLSSDNKRFSVCRGPFGGTYIVQQVVDSKAWTRFILVKMLEFALTIPFGVACRLLTLIYAYRIGTNVVSPTGRLSFLKTQTYSLIVMIAGYACLLSFEVVFEGLELFSNGYHGLAFIFRAFTDNLLQIVFILIASSELSFQKVITSSREENRVFLNLAASVEAGLEWLARRLGWAECLVPY
ncbi:unnamed protein product [Protopolystoma xenopodis]|uniref:Uncharacterized protein n=1 Tax=Protopolystoma xenopodis TaxID=117903 RepID=A0A448WXB6_9PLAT|nr:unnamed protein product [Protopolystoma xenopodis]